MRNGQSSRGKTGSRPPRGAAVPIGKLRDPRADAFRERLWHVFQSSELNRTEFGERLGRDQSFVSRILNGDQFSLTRKELEAWARAGRPVVTAHWLETGQSVDPASSSRKVFSAIVKAVEQAFGRNVAQNYQENADRGANSHATIAAGSLFDAVSVQYQDIDDLKVQRVATHLATEAISPDLLVALNEAVGQMTERITNAINQQPCQLSPVLVQRIVEAFDKREELKRLREECVSMSRPNEVFLIDSRFDLGRGFERIDKNFERIQAFMRCSLNDDPFVQAYLAQKLASGHRYLGLTEGARRFIQPINIPSVPVGPLRAMIINTKYGTIAPRLIGVSSRLKEERANFESSLLTDCKRLLQIDLSSFEAGEEESVIRKFSSTEAISPLGLYYCWKFTCAADETEAEEYFIRMLRLARALVTVGQADGAFGDYALREAWWHLARLLPHAYLRDFKKLSKRIISVCECSDTDIAIFNPSELNIFHAREREELRSPVYLSYLLIRSLQEYEEVHSSQFFERAFIKNKRLWSVTNNAILARAVSSIGARIGIKDVDSLRIASNATVDDDDVMIRCLSKAHS
jgi:hypothetical protein